MNIHLFTILFCDRFDREVPVNVFFFQFSLVCLTKDIGFQKIIEDNEAFCKTSCILPCICCDLYICNRDRCQSVIVQLCNIILKYIAIVKFQILFPRKIVVVLPFSKCSNVFFFICSLVAQGCLQTLIEYTIASLVLYPLTFVHIDQAPPTLQIQFTPSYIPLLYNRVGWNLRGQCKKCKNMYLTIALLIHKLSNQKYMASLYYEKKLFMNIIGRGEVQTSPRERSI